MYPKKPENVHLNPCVICFSSYFSIYIESSTIGPCGLPRLLGIMTGGELSLHVCALNVSFVMTVKVTNFRACTFLRFQHFQQFSNPVAH